MRKPDDIKRKVAVIAGRDEPPPEEAPEKLVSISARYIPVSLRQRIKAIASEHHVSMDQVVRLFLELGVAADGAGELDWNELLKKKEIFTLY